MNSAVKGILLNSLAKHSPYALEYDNLRIMVNKKQQEELMGQVQTTQKGEHSEHDCMLMCGLLVQ